MITIPLITSAIAFGAFVVAAFKILFQSSIVREAVILATDADVKNRLPRHISTSKHKALTTKSKNMLIMYWAFWYPTTVIAGAIYAWFATSYIVEPSHTWPIAAVVGLTIGFTLTIFKGMFSRFPPQWFAEWSLDLALIENQTLIDRVETKLNEISSVPNKTLFHIYAEQNFNDALKQLQQQREYLLQIKQYQN